MFQRGRKFLKNAIVLYKPQNIFFKTEEIDASDEGYRKAAVTNKQCYDRWDNHVWDSRPCDKQGPNPLWHGHAMIFKEQKQAARVI